MAGSQDLSAPEMSSCTKLVFLVSPSPGAYDRIPFHSLCFLMPIPRILTIGPTFRIDASAMASLDINADLTVGLNYAIEEASMVYPPTSKHAIKNGGTFKFVDTRMCILAAYSTRLIDEIPLSSSETIRCAVRQCQRQGGSPSNPQPQYGC